MATAKKQNFYSYIATSLEELLIYILLSSILFIILLQFYSLVKHKLASIEQQIEILYKYNVADFLLKNNITQAGYKGPASAWSTNNYNSVNSLNHSQLVPLAAIAVCKPIVSKCKEFVSAKILDKIITHQINPDSDILLVYDIPEKVETLEYSMLNYHDPLKVSKNFANILTPGDQLIIADLHFTQRFIGSNIIGEKIMHAKPYNLSENFIKKFQIGSEIILIKHLAFYLAKDLKNDIGRSNLYIDYLASNVDRHAHAIIDNVKNFQVKILDQNTDQILSAANFGWIFHKYILIELTFIEHDLTKNFTIGIDLRNV